MALHTSPDFSVFGQLMVDFIKENKPRPGNTSKESERNLAVHRCVIEDIGRHLSYVGTQERCAILGPLFALIQPERQWVPMLEGHEVDAWLRDVRKRWDDKEFVSVSDEDWLTAMRAEFDSIVQGDGFSKLVQGYRKDGILAGVLDPTPDDIEWLQKDYEIFSATAKPYEFALQKAQLAKRHADEIAALDSEK